MKYTMPARADRARTSNHQRLQNGASANQEEGSGIIYSRGQAGGYERQIVRKTTVTVSFMVGRSSAIKVADQNFGIVMHREGH